MLFHDLGSKTTISGIKMLPRQDMETGRIKDFKLYLADKIVLKFVGLYQ